MRVITRNRRLPIVALWVLATMGWISVLYLAWVVATDSWDRTMFSFQAIAGRLPELDPFNQRYVENPRLTLFHTIPGMLFAVLGPLQFMGPIRRRFPRVHRVSGRVFVVIGILSGIAAFLIGFRFPIWGFGFNWTINAAASLFMVYAFVTAFRHAKARRFPVHREWMIRGFSIGLGVALFRVFLRDVLPRLGMESFDDRWNTVVWISFPIMLGIAELWIRATRPKVRVPAAAPEVPAGATEPL
ncbi:MAG TPA: DUF2306 domain-containing protein [Longimicrobiales bacterium]|nr:DUF2306 domain-containing protein [Longimicrobiales bacterium]